MLTQLLCIGYKGILGGVFTLNMPSLCHVMNSSLNSFLPLMPELNPAETGRIFSDVQKSCKRCFIAVVHFAKHLKNTGSNHIKLVPRDRGTHYLGTVIVFIRIKAIFIDKFLKCLFTFSCRKVN